MFSIHKPKIYRSLQGCCICRAKSSSSRFTASKRYENDFKKCFDILEARSGEICNACVLLVKRWKKLPMGSTRNWHHVVDARAGPGLKSMSKIKNKAAGSTKQDPLTEERFKKKHKHKHHKKSRLAKLQMEKASKLKQPVSPSNFSDDIGDDCLSEDQYSNCDPDYVDDDCYSQSDASDDEMDSRSIARSSGADSGSQGQRKSRKSQSPLRFSSFLDLNYWKKTEICCGIVFKGSNGELLLDPSLMRPCRTCNINKSRSVTPTSNPELPSCVQATKPACYQSDFGIYSTQQTIPIQPPLSNPGAAAMVLDTDPPAPVEVEPIMDDQGPAVSPMSAQTAGLMDVDVEVDSLMITKLSKTSTASAGAESQVLDLATAKLLSSPMDSSACGQQRQQRQSSSRRCLPPLKV